MREDLDSDWEQILNRLLSVSCNLNENQEPQPVIIRFDNEAKKTLYAWQHRNAELCDNEMSDNVISFFCKLEIYVLRFCLILRMARWAVSDETQSPEMIEADDVNGAIRLAEYFRQNALAVITCVSEEKLNDLHRTVYDHLTDEFSTADGIKTAERFGMKNHTFKRIRQGWYRKMSCYSTNNVTADGEV